MPDVYALAANVRTVVEAYFTAHGVTLPDRRYVYPSAPAIDCEQLVVYPTRIYAGQPGVAVATALPPQHWQVTASLRVEIARKVTGVTGEGRGAKLPTATQMQGDAQTVMTDATTLLAALQDARARYLLTPRGVPFAVSEVVPLPVSGLYGGCYATLDLPVLDATGVQ